MTRWYVWQTASRHTPSVSRPHPLICADSTPVESSQHVNLNPYGRPVRLQAAPRPDRLATLKCESYVAFHHRAHSGIRLAVGGARHGDPRLLPLAT